MTIHTFLAVLLLAAGMALLPGCSGKDDAKQAGQPVPAEETGQAAPAAPAGGASEIEEWALDKARKYGSKFEPLVGYTDMGEPVNWPGVKLSVASDRNTGNAMKVLKELKREFSGSGYRVFITDINYGMSPDDKLALMNTDDPFAILKVMQTGGVNYDIFPKDVQDKLAKWDREFGVDVLGASFDWAWIEFRSKPPNMRAFAEEVYEFCPDSVDQGTGSVDALVAEMDRTNGIFLWWD